MFGERFFAVEFRNVRDNTEERLQFHQPFGDLKDDRLVFQEKTFLVRRSNLAEVRFTRLPI